MPPSGAAIMNSEPPPIPAPPVNTTPVNAARMSAAYAAYAGGRIMAPAPPPPPAASASVAAAPLSEIESLWAP